MAGKIALISASVLVGLVIGEIAVRQLPDAWLPQLAPRQARQIDITDLHRPSGNPLLYYELIPGVAGVNQAGYRGPEYTEAKPDGVKRIVGIGNSTAFGSGVGEGDTYLRRLEMLLNTSGGEPVQVVNLAVAGYNTHQELEMLKTRGFDFDPDLIVLGYDHNDPDPILGGGRPPIPDDYGRNGLHSELLRLLMRTFYDRFSLRFSNRTDGYISGGDEWDSHVGALKEIARLSRERGIPLVIVIYDAWIVREDFEQSRHYRELHEPLRSLWREEGFHVLECYELFQSIMAERGWQDIQPLWVSIEPRDGHPNAEGHELIAKAALEVIEANGLLR
jgi:lysophospholipase L1-like esterase